MNDSKRTPAKQAKLKLKSFFKRNMSVDILKSDLDCKTDRRITIQGSGSGGGKGDITTGECYKLESIKPAYLGCFKKAITQRFNKPQLKGKLILIEGEYFRIISKY